MKMINVVMLFMFLFCSCLTVSPFSDAINQRNEEGKVGMRPSNYPFIQL